jgi:hypothetical protein
MEDKIKYVKVKWVKAHWDYAISAGDVGIVDALRAPQLLEKGFIIPIPDAEDVKDNPLPEDFPARSVLFNAGFDNLDKIREAGDSLLDAGISNTTLKKVKAYLNK